MRSTPTPTCPPTPDNPSPAKPKTRTAKPRPQQSLSQVSRQVISRASLMESSWLWRPQHLSGPFSFAGTELWVTGTLGFHLHIVPTEALLQLLSHVCPEPTGLSTPWSRSHLHSLAILLSLDDRAIFLLLNWTRRQGGHKSATHKHGLGASLHTSQGDNSQVALPGVKNGIRMQTEVPDPFFKGPVVEAGYYKRGSRP